MVSGASGAARSQKAQSWKGPNPIGTRERALAETTKDASRHATPDAPECIDHRRRCTRHDHWTCCRGSRGSASLPCHTLRKRVELCHAGSRRRPILNATTSPLYARRYTRASSPRCSLYARIAAPSKSNLSNFILDRSDISIFARPAEPITSHQPPATSHQPPATSHQPPATSHQPPATTSSPIIAMKTGFLLIGALVLALLVSFAAEGGGPQSKIAFERGSNVWIANIDGTKARKLIKGDDPRIAPDGTKVAFTITPPGNKDVERYIAVVDAETGATKIFKDMPSDNCFGPVWSPNGLQILFEIFVDNHWRLGLVNADGSGFQFFKTPFRDQGWSSPCWAPDAINYFESASIIK